MTNYNGKCPLCQGVLDESAAVLTCENGDYSIAQEDFENAWVNFNTRIIEAEQLLALLIAGNLTNENPS